MSGSPGPSVCGSSSASSLMVYAPDPPMSGSPGPSVCGFSGASSLKVYAPDSCRCQGRRVLASVDLRVASSLNGYAPDYADVRVAGS